MATKKEKERRFREIEREIEEEPLIVREVPSVFTFAVPAKRGFYYLAVDATSREGAVSRALEISGDLPEVSGIPRHLSIIRDIDSLVIDPRFKERFRESGYAHSYKKKRLAPYHVRTRHRGFLPE